MEADGSGHQHARRLSDHLKVHRATLVMDGDTHISDPQNLPAQMQERMNASPDYFQGKAISAEDLLWEMDRAGVDMALCWQNPAATPYGDDLDANCAALLAANRYIYESAQRHPRRLVPAGWTDPRALGLDNALALVDTCVRQFGFAVVKMNPAQNAYPLDSELVFAVVDRIVELGAVPAFHYGADTPYTPATALRRVAQRYADHPVIGVHMGGGGASYNEADALYQQSRALGLQQHNIYFVLSAKRDTHIESDLIAYQAAGEPFCRRISVASDAPYGRLSWNYGGYRQMFKSLRADGHPDPRLRAHPGLFDDEAIRGYMGCNLAELLITAYERILN